MFALPRLFTASDSLSPSILLLHTFHRVTSSCHETPGSLPGVSLASQAGRRHPQSSASPPSANNHQHPRPSSASASNRGLSSSSSSSSASASPPPRYIPAHLQDEVLGSAPRSPTPDSDPSTACAGLTLSSDPPTDMSSSEQRDASLPPAAVDARSPSPGVKRAASEVDGDVDVDMDAAPTGNDMNDAMNADDDDTSTTNGGNLYFTPSSMSTNTPATTNPSDSSPPSYDDQVAKVTLHMAQPLKEKQKGYVVSMSWLKRVLSRSSTHADLADKTAVEGDVGPVDNSDLVLVTDPANAGLVDEANKPFVPLRPGLQMGEDFEIVPQEGWDLILRWYGLAEQSPAIVRYAHDTSVGGDSQNVQYEINPPIFTILKLTNPSTGTTPQSLKEKNMKPVRILSSRHTNFQKWLKDAKSQAKVDMATKVRVWRILGGLGSATASAAITPAVSRSASPAPAASMVANGGNSLVLDLNTFLSLSEGAQRELLEGAKDQTANPNYNGRMTLDVAGLGGSDVVVLEERIPGAGNGEWASEASKQTLNRLGVPTGSLKNGVASKLKNKSPTSSGRSSPVPEPPRGRRKDGKPRGNTGLSNLGNTCYMNSALQCVRSVEELSYYFLNDVYKQDLNPSNPLAHNGEVAKSYANLLRLIYDEAGQSSFAPRQLKNTIGRYGPAFSGYGQQDSQEFLLFLLDGLQEDLNRIQKKPYIEKPDSTDDMVHDKSALTEFADKCWDIYKARNDSVITDLFAGMYKSTLHCPECDKVSIIFDPFNNLTLQLPIENVWSKEIFYFPLHSKPLRVEVEIDTNSSIKSLKELVAKKVGSDAQRLVMTEIYKNKFYKLFDNTSSIAEAHISANDDIAMYEVESVPTNYNPDKPQRSFHSFSRSDRDEIPELGSPKADRLLVSVFNRVERPKGNNAKSAQRTLFGVPSFIIVDREDAYSWDAIYKKLLLDVAPMTTRDILNEQAPEASSDETGPEDSDISVMNEDDAQSADSKIKTTSVDGEEGMVDVSMRDAPDASQDADSTESSIPSRLRNLFEIKLIRSNETVPIGFSAIEDNKEYPRMSFRIKTKPAVAEEPESVSEAPSDPQAAANNGADDNASDSESDAAPPAKRPQKQVQERPLIRPGEAFVLDWNEDVYDALFTGKLRDRDSIRGAPTWNDVDRLPDPELTKRRQLRQMRKKKGVTLDECLDEFNKEEVLSENDAWYCPRCKEHRRASKKFELWKTPDILVMHLKRFSASRGFRDKLDVLVDFPVEGLDMTGRVEAPEDGKGLIYDLFAVDNHYGGLGGGHYTAYAKNFMTGQWNEYNDSSVSRPLDPQSVVTSSAYLLFYRRRSSRPLGGKILEDITESSTRPPSESDSASESRGQSPSGDGRRLGGSSLNGSSSVSTGAGAGRQGDGGLQVGTPGKNRGGDESPPEYAINPTRGEKSLGSNDKNNRLEGMNIEDDEESGDGELSNPFGFPSPPSWSFNRVHQAHGPSSSQMTTALPGSTFDDDDDLLDDDTASNKAVGGGDMSDSDLRLAALTDSPGPGAAYPGTPIEESAFQDIPPLLEADNDDDDDDDELPVVELRVNDEDRIVSD
ncbi:hypothetical protein N8T08_010222 [Aspergillus melleus]|uniref:Uncharacterized protein n=1 Tax=Aspergillus melleus TaxID=138277 RepID=A0ACC3AS73_9EURO|nr:hypothetical protein N8T08_010222 [Aspergillus melleus]